MFGRALTFTAWLLVMPRKIASRSTSCPTTTPPPSITSATLLSFTNLQVTCGTSVVEATMDDCAVQCLGHNPIYELGITSPNLSNVTMSDVAEGCYPTISGNNTLFSINITDCSPTKTGNKTHSIYTYAINSFTNTNLQSTTSNSIDISFRFSCIYNLGVQTSLSLGGSVSQSSSLSFQPVSVELAIAMALFNDSTFSVPIVGDHNITVPDYIYVGLTFTDGNANYLVLQATTCWATPSSSSSDARQYSIIASGCPANLSDPTLVLLYENYYSSQARFALQAFTWAGLALADQNIYIHCDVAVCDTVLNDTCTTKNCVGSLEARRKRSIDGHLITVGPLKVVAGDSACSKMNGGCSHMCSEDFYGFVRCICGPGFVLLRDRKSCGLIGGRGVNEFDWHEGVHLSAGEDVMESSMSDYILFAASSLILFACVGLLIGICRKKNRSRKRKYKGAHEL